jgi:hypothetical protein
MRLEELARLAPDVAERIVVDPVTECWIWTGRRNSQGYGRKGDRLVHRLVKELWLGRELKPEEYLDHICLTPPCCNPLHTEVTSPAENTRRWAETQVTHCPHGHAYTPENTLVFRTRHGLQRRCRTCHAERERLRRRGLKLNKGRSFEPTREATRIGWIINRSGRPLHWWAAEARMSMRRLQWIAVGRIVPTLRDLAKLQRAFNAYGIPVEQEDLIGAP